MHKMKRIFCRAMHLRNAAGSYIPNDCSSNWVGTGNGLITMSNLAPGTYWAVLDNDLFNQFNDGTFCTDSVEIVIPDLGTTCGRLSGPSNSVTSSASSSSHSPSGPSTHGSACSRSSSGWT